MVSASPKDCQDPGSDPRGRVPRSRRLALLSRSQRPGRSSLSIAHREPAFRQARDDLCSWQTSMNLMGLKGCQGAPVQHQEPRLSGYPAVRATNTKMATSPTTADLRTREPLSKPYHGGWRRSSARHTRTAVCRPARGTHESSVERGSYNMLRPRLRRVWRLS